MTRKALAVAVLIAAALWYLRDPVWLAQLSSGLRPWETASDGTRYRWSGGHASFFVPASASTVSVPIATTFDAPGDRAETVRITIDDRRAALVVLADSSWHIVTLRLPPPGARRLRRVDIRTDVVRDDNHGVKIGELSATSAADGSTR